VHRLRLPKINIPGIHFLRSDDHFSHDLCYVAKILDSSRAVAEQFFVGKLADNFIFKFAADIRTDPSDLLIDDGTRFFGV
jgi:hypothetical protein